MRSEKLDAWRARVAAAPTSSLISWIAFPLEAMKIIGIGTLPNRGPSVADLKPNDIVDADADGDEVPYAIFASCALAHVAGEIDRRVPVVQTFDHELLHQLQRDIESIDSRMRSMASAIERLAVLQKL